MYRFKGIPSTQLQKLTASTGIGIVHLRPPDVPLMRVWSDAFLEINYYPIGPCKPNWDIGIWVIFPGILPLSNWDIQSQIWDIGILLWCPFLVKYCLWALQGLGYWDLGPTKLGYWEMGPLKLGYLGYRDPPLQGSRDTTPWLKILRDLTRGGSTGTSKNLDLGSPVTWRSHWFHKKSRVKSLFLKKTVG